MSDQAARLDPTKPPPTGPSLLHEIARTLGTLLLIALLFAACILAPTVVAALVSPWLGVAIAFGSFWAWGRFGPPPCPGMLNGIVCLSGHSGILGALLACVGLGVKRLLS